MTDPSKTAQATGAVPRNGPGTGTTLRTLLAVTLLLAAVVGGAWFVNRDMANLANVSQPEQSSTGTSSGETGTDSAPQKTP